MIGIFSARLELLIVGQEVPLFKGYWTGYTDSWPSFTEWMLVPLGAELRSLEDRYEKDLRTLRARQQGERDSAIKSFGAKR